jgi:hypothetical protein
LIQASSMANTSRCKITLRPESIFCFRTISSVADEEGILRRIADTPKKKPSPRISEKARTKQQMAPPPAPRTKTTSCKIGAKNSFTRRTLLSISSTEEWTRIMRKKEASGIETHRAALLAPSPSKKDRKKLITPTTPFYPDVLLIGGRVESSPISDNKPTVHGEEPPQREARRRRNRRRNVRRHHEAGERGPVQPVSQDEISEVGETPDE